MHRQLLTANFSAVKLLTAKLLLVGLGFCGNPGIAQQLDLPLADAEQSAAQLPQTRALRVLSPTLAPEQIDRAVLNRLLQEILTNPEATATQFGMDTLQLQDMLTLIANAHGFINDNEPANVQAMCSTWDNSDLQGEARIDAALAAYARRAQFTLDFIALYYRVVLANIEAGLSAQALPRFQAYMDDRRRRMASAGATTGGAVSQNARSGEESIRFHCRSN